MIRIATSIVACMSMVLAAGVVYADSGTAYVATANGSNAFTINNNGQQLYYHVQPDTDYGWYDVNGDPVTYTYNNSTAIRDGMKTFAATNVAFGATIGSLQLSFQYASDDLVDGNGCVYRNYPGINVHITDGNGNYAIWSATSGGTGFSWGTPVDGRTGWEYFTMDCTSFADDSVFGKINESTNTSVLLNGNLNATTVQWSDIKNWTIAGFYTEQFAPSGDWDDWGQNLWSDISEAGDVVPENQYGVSLFWGDTVGSMYGDGTNTDIGALAERPYGKDVKMIDNLVVTAGGTSYDITFEADVIPEPASMALLGLGLAGLVARRRK
ncbi:MAG: PEP-CTERM sorting domain-containing protein [Planctomycetes bacterium]|nr:PEP-CTERM sorting domain-containing protein [Planctomycetota bacterium]